MCDTLPSLWEEPVAHPANGDDVSWIFRFSFELLPELQDVVVDGACFHAVFITQHLAEYLAAINCPLRIFHEEFECFEFTRSESDRLTVEGGFRSCKVYTS